jgi:signal peptidase I
MLNFLQNKNSKQADNITQKKPKSQAREWFDAVIVAVAAAVLVRWCIVEACTIPTPSMEGTLLVGDFLFVSKLHYGARTPQTPLQIPLTHQNIWGTNTPSFASWLQLPSYRLPAFSKVQRNDVVVFNYSGKDEDFLPVDVRTNFIKRCVALPKDTLEISDMKVYVNGKLSSMPAQMQSGYYVLARDVISESAFQLVGISDYRSAPNGYFINATAESARNLRNVPSVDDVIPIKQPKGKGNEKVFPFSILFEWNLDNFGALVVPAKDMTIVLDEKNLTLYESIILRHENNQTAKVEKGKLYIDNQEVKTYTFKQNYYFMLGDNRHNSDDSRIWGFVPESHIVGKALWVWWSMNPEGELTDIFSRIRWSRIGSAIN